MPDETAAAPLPTPTPAPPLVPQTYAARMTKSGSDGGGPFVEITLYGQIPRTKTGTAPVLDAAGKDTGQTVDVFAAAQEWSLYTVTARPTASDFAGTQGLSGAQFAQAVAATMLARVEAEMTAKAKADQQAAALAAVVGSFSGQTYNVTPQ